MKMYSELKFFGRENTVTLKRDQLSKSLISGIVEYYVRAHPSQSRREHLIN